LDVVGKCGLKNVMSFPVFGW